MPRTQNWAPCCGWGFSRKSWGCFRSGNPSKWKSARFKRDSIPILPHQHVKPFFMTLQYISIIHQLTRSFYLDQILFFITFNPCFVIFVDSGMHVAFAMTGKPCGEDLAEGRPSQVHRRTMVLPHRGGGGAKHPWRGSPVRDLNRRWP